MVTGIEMRAPVSQNFKVKKCKLAVSLPEKLTNLIFEGKKLKIAENLYFHTKLMIPKSFLGFFIFRAIFVVFHFPLDLL